MIITISGPPGSGKSTITKMLAQRLGIPAISAGELFRASAKRRKMTLSDFGKLAEKDWNIDRELDKKMLKRAKKVANAGKDIILEGRLTGILLFKNSIPSIRIFIDAEQKVRAERIAGREKISVREALRAIREREICEQKRYRLIYGLNLDAKTAYNIVIDSTSLTPEGVVEKIITALRKLWSQQ